MNVDKNELINKSAPAFGLENLPSMSGDVSSKANFDIDPHNDAIVQNNFF